MNTPPAISDASDPHVWEKGWDGHRIEQMLRMSRLTLVEKLAWLEEAHRVVRQLAAQNAAADVNSESPNIASAKAK